MLILIEGADNTGKSTLAKELISNFNEDFYYHHCSKPESADIFQEYVDLIEKLSTNHSNVVMDRGYLGEYVYSQLWRGKLSMSEEQFVSLDNLCKKLFKQFFVIHASAPVEVIKKRCRENGELLLMDHEVTRCCSLFNSVMDITSAPVVKYDSNTLSTRQFVSDLKQKFIKGEITC